MTENLNGKVLERIQNLIPENIKPVNYLMDTLDLGKESAYRRLRGEKAFSFEEIAILSEQLGFSLDEIILNDRRNTALFKFAASPAIRPEEGMIEYTQYYEAYLDRISKDDDSKIIVTMNHLFYSTLLRYDYLFKFVYYKWMHQMKEVSLNFMFADIAVDSRILDMRKRLIQREQFLSNVTYIIDKYIFLNMIRQIQYFYKRGLITVDELEMIKKDFFTFMDEMEKILKRGIDHSGNVSEIYLSVLNIDSNTIYAESGGKTESSFWLCYGHPIKTENDEITTRHKHWIDSLKKYTTVISKSNEIEQADFFNQQRQYINNITEEIWL